MSDPVWPWRLWGDLEPDKARLEMAIHRVAQARCRGESQEPEGVSHGSGVGGVGGRREMRLVPGLGVEVVKDGADKVLRCAVRSAVMTSLRSRHPNPIRPPGLETALFLTWVNYEPDIMGTM